MGDFEEGEKVAIKYVADNLDAMQVSAASLHAALPDLADEINFVLKKSIDALTVAENTALEAAKSMASQWLTFQSAISEYGACGKEKGELYDLDDFEGYKIEGTLTEVQAKMRYRFRLVLNRLHDVGFCA
ncbi:hypothetical protein Vi05172_g3127 [Venturia inaequalis]|nr:hypothetical protein Vi05172_g3127 [Venturia inaequalis]